MKSSDGGQRLFDWSLQGRLPGGMLVLRCECRREVVMHESRVRVNGPQHCGCRLDTVRRHRYKFKAPLIKPSDRAVAAREWMLYASRMADFYNAVILNRHIVVRLKRHKWRTRLICAKILSRHGFIVDTARQFGLASKTKFLKNYHDGVYTLRCPCGREFERSLEWMSGHHSHLCSECYRGDDANEVIYTRYGPMCRADYMVAVKHEFIKKIVEWKINRSHDQLPYRMSAHTGHSIHMKPAIYNTESLVDASCAPFS